MNTQRTPPRGAAHNRPKPLQALIRWAVALVGAFIAAFILPAGESAPELAIQAAAYFVLAFLLVNALRFHMVLRSACAMAVIAACVLITGSEAIESIVCNQQTPDTLIPGLGGAIVGAAVSFPTFKRIHRAETLHAAQREHAQKTR